MQQETSSEREKAKTLTVLLHGLLRTRYSMLHLQPILKRAGINCIALSYPSTRFSLRDNSEMLARRISSLAPEDVTTVNFVGHSLGTQISRYIDFKQTELFRPGLKVGRIVMLAPPNQGSQAARLVCRVRPLFNLLGPVMRDLSENKFPDLPHQAEIGIIAGNVPLLSRLLPWKAGPESDGTLSIAETRLPGIEHWIQVRAMHSSIMYDPRVIKEIINFLKEGHFARKS